MHFFSNVGVISVVFSTALALVGCGAPDRPFAEATTADADDNDGNDANPTSYEPPIETCEVGASRDCRKTWVDIRNQKHCTPATQHCRANGAGWLECGVPPNQQP